MARKFYTSYVHDSWTGEKIFDNSIITIDINDEKQIPVLLQQKLTLLINKDSSSTGRFFPVTLINFWEID
jgi:hypothetical protein